MLAALGHPQGRGLASPIFRTIRPGFLPWFVTGNEARTLAECIRAVIVVCGAIASQRSVKFWELADTYPMVTRMEGTELRYHVEMFHSVLPPESPVAPVRLAEETLLAVRAQDYAVRGDGARHNLQRCGDWEEGRTQRLRLNCDRCRCAERNRPCSENNRFQHFCRRCLAKVFLKAIQTSRTLPKEVRVSNQKLKDSLAPLMESFGVTVRVVAGSRPQTKLSPICLAPLVENLAADRSWAARSWTDNSSAAKLTTR